MTNGSTTCPETITVRARDGCAACGGRGYTTEPHGEELDCDCALADLTPREAEAVEMGAFILLPAQGYLARMAKADSAEGGAA